MNNERTRSQRRRAATRRNFFSALGIVFCIIFGFLLICNLVIIVKGTLYPEKPPSVFGVTPMAVLSGSMSGERDGHIEVGDLIFVGKAEPEKLEVGDVIAFMVGDTVVTHRIVEVQTAESGNIQWITKGDANNTADQNPVSEENLVGIFKIRIPKLGDLVLFSQTPLGMCLFVVLPVLLFLLYDMLRRRKYLNLEEEKKAEMEAELKELREQVRIRKEKKNQ